MERFSTGQPYNVPERLPRNMRYARILLSAYSGPESELTASTQYIYHHIMAGRAYPEAGEVLRGIAIVEMRHLDMLGECIRQLGLHPTYSHYQGTRRVRWNSGFVRYGRNPREMIDIDIMCEHSAIKSYENAIRQIPEPAIQQLLEQIIEDERIHLQRLEELKTALSAGR